MKPSTGNPAGMRYDPWSGCDVYDGRTSPRPPVAAPVSGAWDIIIGVEGGQITAAAAAEKRELEAAKQPCGGAAESKVAGARVRVAG